MLKIALLGASGRMGRAIADLVARDRSLEIEISGRWDGAAAGDTALLDAAIDGADVAVDFTHADATLAIVAALTRHRLPLVSGTTGLADAQLAALRELANSVAVLHDGNMSVAVQLMAVLSARVAAFLPDYDIEISETHHRFKRDAPSGTALKLGEAVAAARGTTLADTARHDRHGVSSERRDGEIGFAVQRGGSVVGEHTVAFYGPFDSLELRHRAHDRRLFADGALRAARWLAVQKPGIYSVASLLPAL